MRRVNEKLQIYQKLSISRFERTTLNIELAHVTNQAKCTLMLPTPLIIYKFCLWLCVNSQNSPSFSYK